MDVVTISRQNGSLGYKLADQLSQRLDYRLVGRELINQAALRAGVPEVALAMIDELGLLGLCPSPQKCQAYVAAVKQVMFELAQSGKVVIVGRGGQVVLADNPRCLHIRVVAPMALRVERVAQEKGVNLDAAQAQIKASDQSRLNYLRRIYKIRADDPAHYHLTINTGKMSLEDAVELIVKVLKKSDLIGN